MNLLGSTEKKVTNDKNVQHLDFNVVPLNHFNAANNDYQQDSCFFLYAFVPDKSFCQLLEIFKKHFIQSFHILRFDLLIIIVDLLK